ncbi:NAD-dependent succinate-semialdehyde dehydrogenase [Mycolicibacterium goodii]|uniref:NAD-dependent succinate-semialdehyde dehydrogenase n=1 Tax=Mycolicibacterium goodii TaxID=134601 RepID=UPI001F033F34|nr:NAD-dependent succinate-semialdehyde dehydrogenase [Mycolicibacterium goodii]ULN49580.1 NAD-dependent succinate-semialdehyde dehydrogenase [Mycolicibacterium goodii]
MRAFDHPRAQLFIAGEWRDGGAGTVNDLVNPATDEVLGVTPRASIQDLDNAANAADEAFPGWSRTSAVERSAILNKTAALLRARTESIARDMTREQGKPLAEAKLEVALSAETFEWFAGEALRSYGRTMPARFPGQRHMVINQPLGPVLALTPWNFPILLPARKIAAALAAGCTVVIKPAEETPSPTAAIARALHDAGLPAGALNIVLGVPSEISSHLIAVKAIRKISFTGSTTVGRHLAGLAAQYAKPNTMELGGHAPVVIFADADLEKTVAACVAGKTRNAGQVCTSPTRFIVHESIRDEFVSRFGKAMSELRIGEGFDPGVQMGPLANGRRLVAVGELVDDAAAQGAEVVIGGSRIGTTGNFFQPTLIADAPITARAMNEEPFGPVALVNSFTDMEDALAQAHRLDVGLAGYVFTQSADIAMAMGEALQAGGIGINSFSVSSIEAPFGGLKDSGYGYEGGYEGLDGYQHHKYINHIA